MVEEAGAPILLVVRVKVDGEQKLSELELVATRSRADGLLFNVDGLSGAPALAMNLVPRPEQLETRDEAIQIAMHYPRGLSDAKTFNAIGTPFAPEAFRLENGALMAGPGLHVRAGLRRHRQPVAGDLRAPRPGHGARRRGRRAHGDRDHAPVVERAAAPARTG